MNHATFKKAVNKRAVNTAVNTSGNTPLTTTPEPAPATIPAAILASLLAAALAFLPLSIQAETVRDCKVTGTVKRASASSDNVFVDLHSVRPAESGAPCQVRHKEKLKFRLPASPELADAKPGTRVEYRYTEDTEEGSSWKLQKVSR